MNAPAEKIEPTFEMKIVPVKQMTARDWDKAWKLLDLATKYGLGDNVETVIKEIISGELTLWRVNDWQAAIATTIEHKDIGSILYINYVCGDIKDVIGQAESILDELAREANCVEIRAVTSRRGWGRIASHMFKEYQPKFTLYVKKVKQDAV